MERQEVLWTTRLHRSDPDFLGGASWNRTGDLSIISAVGRTAWQGADQGLFGCRTRLPARRDPYVTHWGQAAQVSSPGLWRSRRAQPIADHASADRRYLGGPAKQAYRWSAPSSQVSNVERLWARRGE